MSTLKTTNIQHPSAGSPNLVLAADGSVSGGAGLGGLVHIHTEEFTAVSSVSIDDVFTTEYDTYKITFFPTSYSGTSTHMSLRLRLSGVDNSGANYNTNRFYWSGTSTIAESNPAGSDNFSIGSIDSGYLDRCFIETTLHRPMSASSKAYISRSVWGANGSDNHGFLNSSAGHDGMTVFPESGGTFSGTIRVYGYAND